MSNFMFIVMTVAMLVLWWALHEAAHWFVSDFGILAGAIACVVMYLSAVAYERGRHW
jgi:hypothetical protein